MFTAGTNDIYVPTGWNGQIWAKTHCSPNMVCGTGTPGVITFSLLFVHLLCYFRLMPDP